MSVAKIAFRGEDGLTYGGWICGYWNFLDDKSARKLGVDEEARVVHVTDARREPRTIPFDAIVRINTEAADAYGLDKLIPGARVYAEGYGADQKLAGYEAEKAAEKAQPE